MSITVETVTGLVLGFELLEQEAEDDDNIIVIHLGLFRIMIFY